MTYTYHCHRCGREEKIMAGSPTFMDNAKAEDPKVYGDTDPGYLLRGDEVCEDCARKDGGFCSSCMCKPCVKDFGCDGTLV